MNARNGGLQGRTFVCAFCLVGVLVCVLPKALGWQRTSLDSKHKVVLMNASGGELRGVAVCCSVCVVANCAFVCLVAA